MSDYLKSKILLVFILEVLVTVVSFSKTQYLAGSLAAASIPATAALAFWYNRREGARHKNAVI